MSDSLFEELILLKVHLKIDMDWQKIAFSKYDSPVYDAPVGQESWDYSTNWTRVSSVACQVRKIISQTSPRFALLFMDTVEKVKVALDLITLSEKYSWLKSW